MKILQVIGSLRSGGAERFVVDLSNELVKQGHEVIIVTLKKITADSFHYAKFLDANIKVLPMNLSHEMRYGWWALLKVIFKYKPDIIHAHLGQIAACYPVILFRFKKIRFFYTLHSIAEKTVGRDLSVKLNRFCFTAGRITPVTISDFCNQSYQKFYNLPPADCIYNGRAKIAATPELQKVQTEISKLKLHSDDRVFVLPATICKNKNQGMAVKVFARLHQENRHAVLLMLGKGTEENYLDSIMADAAPNTFYLGVKDNVEDYLNCADAFMLSSVYEGNPMSILEAFACGVVPVCTAVGGIVDTVKEGVSGYLAEKVEVESLYAAVMRYLNDPEKIKPETLKQLFQDNYTMEKCAEKYVTLFRRGS